MSWMNVVEFSFYLVETFALPFAIMVFVFERRKERIADQEELYQRLSDEYTNFLKLVLDNADLQLLRKGASLPVLTEEQKERRHALFGKSREYSVGKRPGWDAWGSRLGAKFVRSYYKKEVEAHRVELQLQLPFLRQHGINEISDLPGLLKILPRHHVCFARLSEQKLTRAMVKSGISHKSMQEIRNEVGARAGNLWDALRYLRRRQSFRNVRRLLVPLRVNQSVREALKAWTAQWQVRSTRPKKKP